jgi:hypothetical protein
VDADVSGNVNVLRKLLLGTEGRYINTDWSLNQTETVNIREAIDVSVANGNSLHLIAFVQDSSRRIHQAIMQKAANNKAQQQVVGVEDPLDGLLSELQIYPNPASGKINFAMDRKIPQGYSYSITDQRGVRLLTGELQTDLTTSPQQVGISELANGIYFVTINRAGKPVLYRKIAVMNQN